MGCAHARAMGPPGCRAWRLMAPAGDTMTDGGAGAPGNGGEPAQPGSEPAERRRLGNPTRLVPRRPSPEPAEVVPAPELVEPGDPFATGGSFPEGPRTQGFGGFGPMFGPRSFGGGRVQVWGCSPGCLIVSIVGSLLLTFILNALL